MKKNFTLLFLMLSFPMIAFLQTATTTYNSGAGNFTVPCNVTSLTVQMWGGGGGGGGDNTNGGINGGGGGGGGYTTNVVAVAPGQVIAYSVGGGGAAGAAAGGNGGAGGNSSFGALTANGGAGGAGSGTGNPGAGGVGSTSNGSNGVTGNGGTGAGGNGGAPGGGNGGAGVGVGNPGNPGTAPGGGGGGGNKSGAFLQPTRPGGAGANGRIVITYNITSAGVDQNLAACATTTTMAATAPAAGTGTWSCVSGCSGVGITNPNLANTTITGLTPGTNTTLRWTVSNAGCTSTTDDVLITTNTGPLCPTYCAADLDDCGLDDGLVNVSFATINSTSTVCTSNTVACASVYTGNTYTLAVTTGDGIGTHSGAAFIDWNSDGDFNDASEYNLISANMSENSTYSISVTVPAGATCNAIVKMRVRYVYSGNGISSGEGCNTSETYGETEDFCLTILCCTPNCSNGVQDCGETGIDCGGPCVSTCAGTESCTDNILNQNETAIDCGGVCPACGSNCTTAWTNQSMVPAEGSIVDASASDQTITACTNITYNNSGNNWVHGLYVSPTSTGFVSSNASGALPEANTNSGLTTYKWSNQTANFTSDNSGQNITANGWFVETGTLNTNPGDNLGWPVSAGTDLGPFCFTTVVSCTGFNGDNPAFLHFRITSDSYSGSWTNTNCGLETSNGANSLAYTLRCPVAMPLNFVYWNGYSEGSRNKLIWSIENEEFENRYEIYKSSKDGKDWIKIGEQLSKYTIENINQQIDYRYYDDAPYQGITYYKIKRFNKNNEITISDVIGVMNSKDYSENCVIPNPVQNSATVVFSSKYGLKSKIEILSMENKEVKEFIIDTEKGMNSYTFDSNDLQKGIYYLKISNENEQILLKFTK